MSERSRPEFDADWIRAMVAKEEELGSLPPGGASGGFGAKRGTPVYQDDEGLTTAPMNDLRAAVARADDVLGCGAMPCRFKDTTGQTTNGRCVCLDHPRAGQALAALYKAAKAVVEEDEAMNISPVVRLSPEQWARFQAICDDQSEPTDALKALLRDKPIHEERFVFTSKPGEFEFYDTAKVAEPRCEVTTKSNEEVRRTWEATLGLDNVLKTCWCFQCLDDPSMGLLNPTMVRMITCPQCGNKRCPRAASHDNACSGSNEPGQDGSG